MDAIARHTEPENSGDDNVRAMALIEAGYRSIAEKRVPRLSEVSKSWEASIQYPNR